MSFVLCQYLIPPFDSWYFMNLVALEMISGPNMASGAWLLSFNRTQSRVVIGLLTGHNTLRRHQHVMRLSNIPICRKCGTEEETSVHILCVCVCVFVCEVLASLRFTYLGSFFLDPEDIRVLGMGANWNFAKGTGLLWPSREYGAQRACLKA